MIPNHLLELYFRRFVQLYFLFLLPPFWGGGALFLCFFLFSLRVVMPSSNSGVQQCLSRE